MSDEEQRSLGVDGTETRSGAPEVRGSARDYNLHILSFLRLLALRWRAVLGIPLLASLGAVGLSFFVSPQYVGRTRFVAETESRGRLSPGLAGLASQFGISVGQGEGLESPDFYAELATTRPVVTAMLTSAYTVGGSANGGPVRKPLLDWLRVDAGKPPAVRLDEGLRELRGRTRVTVDRRTGIVTLEVVMPSPDLAAQVASSYLQRLSEYNMNYRQSRARARREFVEALVQEADSALAAAEDSVRVFYERNREWAQSASLRAREARLRRRLEIRRDLFLSLRRELDQARIDEVNDTPVLTVIDPPVAPVRKSKPRRLQLAWLAFAVSAVGAIVGVTIHEQREHWRGIDPTGYAWLTGLWRSVWGGRRAGRE